MEWLWTWGGKFFGYKDGDDLWTYTGKHVGKFHGEEVYDKKGVYLGELLNGRLITHKSKKHYRQPGFSPYGRRGAYGKFADYAGYAMYAGYEDFPDVDYFEAQN